MTKDDIKTYAFRAIILIVIILLEYIAISLFGFVGLIAINIIIVLVAGLIAQRMWVP